MSPPFRTLEELLASTEVDADDKQRAYKCWKRREMCGFACTSSYGEEPEPLATGDEVVVAGLEYNKSLNGETGVLGSYDADSGRWEVPALGARIKSQNLIKRQWFRAAHYNTGIVYRGVMYTMHIGNDRTVRCLQPNGPSRGSKVLRMNTADEWLLGYNFSQPHLSDFDA
jgi:hypothetical protein